MGWLRAGTEAWRDCRTDLRSRHRLDVFPEGLGQIHPQIIEPNEWQMATGAHKRAQGRGAIESASIYAER